MTYKELVIQYPWIDLILELFSKIVPVAVAILAIIINNTQSSKRDKKNKKVDMIVSYENMLVGKISLLETSLDDLYDTFCAIFRQKNKDKIKDAYKKYEVERTNVINCNIELYNLTFCASDILAENVDGKDISEEVKAIIDSMQGIIVKHISQDLSIVKLSDETMEKNKQIKKDINELKAWLSVDIKRIMEKTLSMLE